jgi:hypothetical protein
MPRETRIVWNEGEPASAIVTAAEKEVSCRSMG